jgi:hypothetical protein
VPYALKEENHRCHGDPAAEIRAGVSEGAGTFFSSAWALDMIHTSEV